LNNVPLVSGFGGRTRNESARRTESFRALIFANESRDGSAKIALSRNRREVSGGCERPGRIGVAAPGTTVVGAERPVSTPARRIRRSESALGGPPIG
jgi:hypothetical protein